MVLRDDELLRAIKKVRKFISKGNIANNDMALLPLADEYGHLDIVRYIMDKGVSIL
ncbi:hypothetical protein OZD61_00590 [Wolbachia endosymbiont of Drosophila bocki]|uniref:hypothetical protein n=1 Tax=Wolbachia endosymbiont of Drosophila bocki TaxID=3002576 RepID=UPI0023AA0318|nr:hypothetical protein [Wolbachia endosymbiont of Drosophila bocki]MDE5057308.1 hypothetical protein [Wolbachia endosymbiont of Drosophila bocki]